MSQQIHPTFSILNLNPLLFFSLPLYVASGNTIPPHCVSSTSCHYFTVQSFNGYICYFKTPSILSNQKPLYYPIRKNKNVFFKKYLQYSNTTLAYYIHTAEKCGKNRIHLLTPWSVFNKRTSLETCCLNKNKRFLISAGAKDPQTSFFQLYRL